MTSSVIERVALSLLILIFSMGTNGIGLAENQVNDPVKKLVFSRISSAISNIDTISSDFSQEKHTYMFENSLISTGRFYYERPDRLRWELLEPRCYGFSVNGGRGKRWAGNKAFQQNFDLNNEPVMKAFISVLFSITSADFHGLGENYFITVLEENPAVLKLVPASDKWKKYLDHLLLFFSSGENPLHTIEIHEPDGDFTRIRFKNALINQSIQPDMF